VARECRLVKVGVSGGGLSREFRDRRASPGVISMSEERVEVDDELALTHRQQ
jgi:hypothetical protein